MGNLQNHKMKTLNLVYPEQSDIKYKIQNFPDGQQDIVIDTPFISGIKLLTVNSIVNDYPIWKLPITIKSRFNSFKDLELIICATKALRRLGVKEIHLYIPYLLGARSDRQFVAGGNSYLVDVIAPIINNLEFESVTVMDVHSDVTAACIKNLKVINSIDLVGWSLDEIYKMPIEGIRNYMNNFILISPDAGSLKKIYKIAEQISYKGDIITCSKHRDTDGNLNKILVPLDYNHAGKDFVIIDDICDGGRTFINIAKAIKNNLNTFNIGKIYLIVTHGIFSAGFDELAKYFDGIYCTNSYRNILTGEDYQFKEGVKQLKVF